MRTFQKGSYDMDFQFIGFTNQGENREFAFDRVADDRSKTRFKVIVSMGLGRQYQIPVQDFPLLCRRLLEKLENGADARTVQFTEQEMRRLADAKVETQKLNANRRPPRRPRVAVAASPWQGPVMPPR